MIPPLAETIVVKPQQGNRPCDITVFGCTGNAGRAVAYHVLRSAASSSKRTIRVGLAGRSRDKVERTLDGIRAEIRADSKRDSTVSVIDDIEVSMIVADATDPASMLSMAESSRVVISCAGPYGRYGEAAVVACIEGKAHYLDITGEVPWVNRMINDYKSSAEKAGVALLPFSGYDCVPAELGMQLSGSALVEHSGPGTRVNGINLVFKNKGGGFPHGTLETILDGFEGKTPESKKDDLGFYLDEYTNVAKSALSPREFLLPKWSDQLGLYTGPNIMAGINTPVLCRAAPTLGFPANNLIISDRYATSNKLSILNTQLYISSLLIAGLALILPPVRWYLRNKLKTYSYPGDAAGNVNVNAQAISNNGASSRVNCVFPGDAGIYATGLFAAAVANALLEATQDGSEFPPPLAGFHSPVASLHRSGNGLLVKHLREMGSKIDVEIIPSQGAAPKEVDALTLGHRR